MPTADNDRDISLVLGSGGARGLAHIGVIHWLEEHGFRIRAVSGCSMGALVGGIYAAGKLDEYERWVRGVDKVDIARMLDFSWQSSGIFKGRRIISMLRRMVGDINIEDLPIAFTAVATDITMQREVWLENGGLFDAIRASISIPLFFTPVELEGRLLVDGGVINPLPIAPAFKEQGCRIVAVNLSGNNPPLVVKREELSTVREKLHGLEKYLGKWQLSLPSFPERDNFKIEGFQVAIHAFETMQNCLSRQKMAAYPPDVTINISKHQCSFLEFHRAGELIEVGWREAGRALSTEG
ncbi:patatin-like phospholipase family protein [Desulforhopalus vacuolatus]|nr:patatin-like phospholipase family protein [Desulforhopalus vacuolatus]